MEEEIILNGALGHDDPRDWTAEDIGEDLQKLNIPVLQDPKTRMNQGNHPHTKSACTIAGSYRQKAQLYDEIAEDPELLRIVERCNKNMEYDYKGQFSSEGINMMVKYHNTMNPHNKILFIKREYNHKDVDYLQYKKNMLLGCTYRGNSKYGVDYRADGVLDGTRFSPSTYGHRTCTLKGYIEDSYYGGTCNRYKLGKDGKNMDSLVRNGVFYPTFYILLKESRLTNKTIDQIKAEQKEKRYAEIFVNANSIFRKFLNKEEQEIVGTLASRYRSKYNLEKLNDDKTKVIKILIEAMKDVMGGFEPEKRGEIMEKLLKLV